MDNTTVVQAVLGVLVSAVLPFIAEYLNQLWKVDGNKALAVAGLVTFVLSFLALWLTGVITNTQVTTFTPANFVIIFTAVYSLSQTEFQIIKQKMGWTTDVPDNKPAVG